MKNWEQVPITQTSLLLQVTVSHNDRKFKTADAYRVHNDSCNLGSEVVEEALDCEDDKKYDMFSSFFLWMTSLFSRQLNLMRLLFSLTHGTMILTQKLARTSCKQMYELTFPSERRKERSEGMGKFLFAQHVCH